MTCRELIQFLDDYVAGELPARVAAAFDEHLAECPPCRNYLRTYQDTIALVRAAESDDPAAEAPTELIEAILAARHRS